MNSQTQGSKKLWNDILSPVNKEIKKQIKLRYGIIRLILKTGNKNVLKSK